MAFGNLVGQNQTAYAGRIGDIDGPTTVATSNGQGQRNTLGARIQDDLGNEYIYLAGGASIAAQDWVTFVPGTFVATQLPASTAKYALLAVATGAIIAGCWGLFQVYGLATAAIASDGSADGKGVSAASGTAGRMTTGPTTTKNVFGAVCVGASAANVGTVSLSYPFEFGTATI